MILVPKDAPGVRVLRPLPVFGYYGVPDRAAECCSRTCGCLHPISCLGGSGFEIAQAGSGRDAFITVCG